MKKKYIAILISILLPLIFSNNVLHINILKNLGGSPYYYEEASKDFII